MIDRARRFAGFFLNEDPEAPNYDAEHNILRAPHNGSEGPRMGMSDDGSPVSYGYSPGMVVYGLPYHNVPGITSVEDIKDPANARRMGEAMEKGMSRGDVANNLGVAPLIANAGQRWSEWAGWRIRRWKMVRWPIWVDVAAWLLQPAVRRNLCRPVLRYAH